MPLPVSAAAFIRKAAPKADSLYKKSSVYRLFQNERPLRKWVVTEPDPDKYTHVYLKKVPTATLTENDSDSSEAEREVTLNFVNNTEQKRRRIFPLKIGTAETIASIKDKLAEELETAWPPIVTRNKVIHISDGKKVLSHDFCPARRAQNGKEYNIHILPADEAFVRMELEIESDSEEVETVPGVVFAPENATVEDLLESISNYSLYPRASLTICVDTKGPNGDDVEEDDDKVEDDEDEKMEDCLDDERNAGGGDDHTIDTGSSSRGSFEPLSLPSDARIKDHQNIFYNGCLLKVKHDRPLALLVKVNFDASREVSEFKMKMYRKETVETMKQAIATEMDTDPRLLNFGQKPDQTIHDCGWRNGSGVEAKVLTKAAEVLIAHVDKCFEYTFFVEDTKTMTVGDMERMIEQKHSFRPKCVRLYLHKRLVNSDLTLKAAGVEMDSILTVRTNVRDSTRRNARQQQRANSAPRGISSRHRSKCNSGSSTNTPEACQRKRVSQKLNRSTTPEGDMSSITSKKLRNLSPSTANLEQPEETTAVALQNAVPTTLGGVGEQYETRQISLITNRSSAAGASGFQDGESLQSMVQMTRRENWNQEQDIRSSLLPQLSTSSQANYENNFEMARIFYALMVRNSQVPFPPLPAPFTATTACVSDEVLQEVAQQLRCDWEDFAVRGLKLGVNDINDLHKKWPSNMLLQALDALQRWRQIHGSQATKAELQRLLQDCDRLLIAQSIECK